eukprot:3345934-Rhodomonas_salina.1
MKREGEGENRGFNGARDVKALVEESRGAPSCGERGERRLGGCQVDHEGRQEPKRFGKASLRARSCGGYVGA